MLSLSLLIYDIDILQLQPIQQIPQRNDLFLRQRNTLTHLIYDDSFNEFITLHFGHLSSLCLYVYLPPNSITSAIAMNIASCSLDLYSHLSQYTNATNLIPPFYILLCRAAQ